MSSRAVLAAVAPIRATAGSSFNFAIPGSHVSSYAVTAGALLAGLSLNSQTGAVTGVATRAGTYTFTITATGSPSVSRSYTVVVDAASALATTGHDVSLGFGFSFGALLLGALLVIRRRQAS